MNGGNVLTNGHEPQVNGDHTAMEVDQEKSVVEKKGDETEALENKDEREHDIILIQDTGFLIQVMAPGIEPFDLPVSIDSFALKFSYKYCLSLLKLRHFLKRGCRSRYFKIENDFLLSMQKFYIKGSFVHFLPKLPILVNRLNFVLIGCCLSSL